MIEGIPGLFKDLKAESEHRIGSSDLDDIKLYWNLGCRLLAADEPRVWKNNTAKIEKIDTITKGLE